MGSKQEYLLAEAKTWHDNGLISDDTYATLLKKYSNTSKWDLKILIRWILLVGSISLGVGLITLVTVMINSQGFLIFMLSAGMIVFMFVGISMRRKNWKVYLPKTGNALITVACLLLCADVFTVANFILPNGDHWSILLLLVCLFYFLISYLTKNSVVLIMGLLALASWYGTESGYISGWGAYFFGMNYPIRFALVTPIVIAIGYLHQRLIPSFASEFTKVYYVVGLLYFNLALWILSICGSTDTIIINDTSGHLQLALYSILWLGLCIGMFLIGTRFDNRAFRGFGLTFIVINLYTRYYEYFWNTFDKWVFFIVIGAVTLIAGLLIERYQKRIAKAKETNETTNS